MRLQFPFSANKSKKKSKQNVTCKYMRTEQVSIQMLLEMHAVFVQYYHNADMKTFIRDMGKKDGVFVMRDEDQNRIIGFSTYTEINFRFKGRNSIGIFSGDTVIEKAYWGNKALQTAFSLKLATVKFTNPKHQVFWLLISKGYKTYLCMTNNFPRHYPSYQNSDSELAEVVHHYCELLFPEYYNRETQILDFGDDYQCLQDDVAEITPEMCMQDPNIRFFNERNLNWRRGTELPCCGEITFPALGAQLIKRATGKSARGKHRNTGGIPQVAMAGDPRFSNGEMTKVAATTPRVQEIA